MPGADRRLRDRHCIEHILRYCEQIAGSLEEIASRWRSGL